MTTALKLRRGTTAQHASFTGAAGEVTVDTTKKTVVVHDGSTAGGTPMAKENSPTFTGVVSFPDGTVANPSITNTDDTNTGFSFPAADTIAASTNGTERMRIDSSGNVGIGTNSPESKLEVAGQLSASPIWIKSGGSSSILYYDGSLSVSKTGTGEQIAVDSSGNFKFASGYGSVATAYGCRAWVNFNGTGTVAIRASGNVSSITDNGTGSYTVNLTTAMPDAGYSVIMNGPVAAGANDAASTGIVAAVSFTTSNFRIDSESGNSAPIQYDSDLICAALFR